MLRPEIRNEIEKSRLRIEARQHRRSQQQGLGRPIISEQVAQQRVVVVGQRIYSSTKWNTFHDFLRDYLLGSLGPDWANAEQAKPLEKRHPILQWYAAASEQAKALRVTGKKLISGPMTGAIRAFMNLAYNIYLIAHHEGGQSMADIYLRRLRSARNDDFVGALFETYAAATFLKAGFKISYEEGARRSTSCVEFVATWPTTGDCYSVEVKTRVHDASSANLDYAADDSKRLRVGSKLVKALSKSAMYTRLVMIEVNIPDLLKDEDQLDGWAAAAVSQIRGNETARQSDGSLYPPAYVFVTNHAFHHDLLGTAGNLQVIADGFRIPDFGPDVRYNGYAEILSARERHSAIMALIDSIRTHYEIPATFDGEMPGTLVSTDGTPRLRIGQKYLVPDGNGKEASGRLISAAVLESEKKIYGSYALDDGRHIMATKPLIPEELEDYRRYPDTFFDALTPVAKRSKTFVDKCDFLFETYQHSSREKLLEFLANAVDIEHLRTLEQRDLAIIYCERVAWSMQEHEAKRKKAEGTD